MLDTLKKKAVLRAMVVLSQHYKDGPTNVLDIAEESGLSVSYIEQLFAYMRRSGLVTGVRGPGGGYVLSRSPGAISVGAVIDAMSDRPADTSGLEPLVQAHRELLNRFTLDRLAS